MKAGEIITLKNEPYEKFFFAQNYVKGLSFNKTYIWLGDFDGVYHSDLFIGKYSLTLDEDKKGFTYRIEEEPFRELCFVFKNKVEFTSGIYVILFEHIKELQYRFLGVFMEADEVSYKYRRVGCRFKRVYETCDIKEL